MKKRFFSACLVGAAVLLSTGSVISCSDYDDDISGLQKQITTNADAIRQLQELYKAGNLITKVESVDGGILVTLSDNSTFTLSNGKDGKDADVWTIENNEWYKNGQPTGYPAKGENATIPSFSIQDGHLYCGGADLGQVVGADGANATLPDFEIKNGHLFVGSQDLGQVVGADGKDGQDGKDGLNGADGKDGQDGKDGLNGADGKDGQDGKDGLNGADGKDGQDGKDGLNGADGKDGKDGKDAIFPDFEIKNGHLWAGDIDLGKVVGADGQKGQDATVTAEIKDGHLYINGKDLGAINGASGKDGKDGGYYRPNANGTFDYVTMVDGKENVKATEISWAENEHVLSATKDGDRVLFKNIKGVEGAIAISTKIALHSLVLEPSLYYQGIQAIDAANFKYTALKVKGLDVNKDCSNDAPEVETVNNAPFVMNFVPDLTATYHLNPSQAKIETNPAYYQFAILDRNYTRASLPSIAVQKVTRKGGKIDVVSRLSNTEFVRDIESEGAVTVLALQYTSGDSTITSDYAAIKANNYENLVLNNAHLATKENKAHVHLWKTAKEAIENNTQIVELVWDNKKGIDLDDLVNTHRDIKKTGKDDVAWDKNAASGEVEKYGFKYSYQLVGYMVGTNSTSESAHAAINSQNVIRPQLTKGGKQQEFGAEQSLATVGREPVVRVVLTDTIHNKIAAVGYIKFRIVATESTPEKADFTFNFTKVYTVECDPTTPTLFHLTWHDIEEQVAHKLNLSVATFRANYQLVKTTTGTAGATQYKATTGEETANPFIGVVNEKTDEQVGTTTDILTWEISNAQAYTKFKTEKKTSVETIIRYELKAGKSGKTPLNVVLNWTPTTINVNPTAKIDAANKITEYWYEKNASAHPTVRDNSHYADIHGNVETIGTTVDVDGKLTAAADDEFVFDVKNTFVGNTVKVTGPVAPYSLSTTPKLTFITPEISTEVPGASGAKYTLGAETPADGYSYFTAKLGATTKRIAKINVVTGVVELLHNDFAMDLLNNADHNDLADRQTLTGKIHIKAETCEPVNDVTLTEGADFNVKFLRPVTAANGLVEAFVDGETNGSIRKVSFEFIDWRDHTFQLNPNTDANGPTKGKDYFDYYGVEEITADIPNITTTMNGGTLGVTKLTSVTKNLVFNYLSSSKVGNKNAENGPFGSLTYENNGNTVGGFKIRVPVKIKYYWGYIYTYVDGEFKSTQGNNAKTR